MAYLWVNLPDVTHDDGSPMPMGELILRWALGDKRPLGAYHGKEHIDNTYLVYELDYERAEAAKWFIQRVARSFGTRIRCRITVQPPNPARWKHQPVWR